MGSTNRMVVVALSSYHINYLSSKYHYDFLLNLWTGLRKNYLVQY